MGLGRIALLAICTLLPLLGENSPRVKRIEIGSGEWNGRKAVSRKIVVHEARTGYAAGRLKIADKTVTDLLEALTAPPMPLSLSALGITREWLVRNAPAALESNKTLTPAQRELFVHAFTDKSSAAQALEVYYQETVLLHDNADIRVKVIREDGSVILFRTWASHAYMLPWEVTIGKQKFQTYNVRISEAVAGMLPEGFPNAARVGGKRDGRPLAVELGSALRGWEQ